MAGSHLTDYYGEALDFSADVGGVVSMRRHGTTVSLYASDGLMRGVSLTPAEAVTVAASLMAAVAIIAKGTTE